MVEDGYIYIDTRAAIVLGSDRNASMVKLSISPLATKNRALVKIVEAIHGIYEDDWRA